MAREIVLRLVVQDDQVEALTQELEAAGAEFDNLGDKSEKATERYSGAIRKSNPIVEELNRKTKGLVNTLLDVGHATKDFNFSLKGTKTALIATGVGAFVVALGLVVVYWDEITDFITGANTELERQKELLNELSDQRQFELDLLNNSDEVLKAQGKTQKEINQLKKDALINLIEAQKRELEIENQRLDQLKAIKEEGGTTLEQFARTYGRFFQFIYGKVDELFARVGIDLGLKDKVSGFQNFIIEGIFGTEEDLAEAEQKSKDLQLKIASLQNNLAAIVNGEQSGGGTAKGLDKQKGIFGNLFPTDPEPILQPYKELLLSGFNAEVEIGEGVIANAKYVEDAKIIAAEEGAAARKKIDELENAQKLMLAESTLGNLAAIFGQNTAAGKIAGSAQALINTYLGVTQVLANKTVLPEPFGTINKIASIGSILATGLRTVQQINAVRVPSFPGSGGAGASPGGSIPLSAPSFNVVGNTGINQALQGIGEELGKPQRSYVVFDDIKKAEQIESESVRGSTI